METYIPGTFVMFDQSYFQDDPDHGPHFLSSIYILLPPKEGVFNATSVPMLPFYDPRGNGAPLVEDIHSWFVLETINKCLKISDDEEMIQELKHALSGWTGTDELKKLFPLQDISRYPAHKKALHARCPDFFSRDLPILLEYERKFLRRYGKNQFSAFPSSEYLL